MPARRTVPKLNGFDIELGNCVDGLDLPGGTGREASLALWRQFEGVCASPGFASGYSQQNWCPSYDTEAGGGWRGSTWSGGYYNCGTSAAPTYGTESGRKWLVTNGACCYIDLSHLELCGAEVLSARDHVAM